jgi:hypothetical protein
MNKCLFWLLILYSQLATSLRQIVYVSTTTSNTGISQSDIEEILLNCRKFNSDNGITGILVYHDNMIFQVIEGESDAIEKVFVRINADSRHCSIVVLHDIMINERSFGAWSMKFRDLSYTEDMESWAYQMEKTLFYEIIGSGGLVTPTGTSTDYATSKGVKLMNFYSRMIFDRP